MENSKNPSDKNPNLGRRRFMKGAAVTAGAFTIVPRHVIGKGYRAPSDTLNIAGVGIGGMGKANLDNIKGENIVALCDVDWKYSQRTFDAYPNAKKYWDWRKMYELSLIHI